MPVVTNVLRSLDDEFSHRDTSVKPDEVPQSVSLSTESREVVLDTSLASDHAKLADISPTDKIQSSYKHSQNCHDERDQPSALLGCAAGDEDINAAGEKEHGKIVSPSSVGNTVNESDFDTIISSGCLSVSMSHSSPDSGVFSKAVSNSLITSQSGATESPDITKDLFNSSLDRSFGLSVLPGRDTTISDSGSPGNNPQRLTVCEILPTCTEEVQSTCLDTDTDDQNTSVDVRSGIMSAGSDDEINQTIVRTDDLEMPYELLDSATSPGQVDDGDGQSEVNDVCLPAGQNVPCLGSQEFSDLSDSDAEDNAVLKTVIAVRTKAAVQTEKCADLIKPLEPDEESEQKLQNDSKNGQISPGVIQDVAVQEHVSFGYPNMDDSVIECGSLQLDVNYQTVNSLQDKNAAALEGCSVALDFVDDRNAVETSAGTNERLSTLSTELDQYMTEHAPRADAGFYNQTCDAAAVDSRQLLGLIATVKTFSEEEDLRIDCSGQKSHSRTRSFTKANSSLPLSRSCSPEFANRSETRRHSCTLSTPQPTDTVEQLPDLSLKHRGREVWQENEITLTASMVDLKLRPSKKKLDFDGLPPDSSQSFFLEPPDEYRDEPMLSENVSFVSPSIVDFCTAETQPADLNVEAKKDHLRRYLKSLATMPGCDTVHDVMDNGLCQDSKMYFQDVSYSSKLDGEDGIELPYHERSTSLLIPDLLYRSDNVENFTEDENLELQLQQYEVMKRQLMEEHRRSLELLLLEQERQMSLLQSRMMGQTTFGESSHTTGTEAHIPNARASSDYEDFKDKQLPADVPNTLDRQIFINEKQIASHSAVGLDLQNVSNSVATAVAGEMLSGRKTRSPAGVFYSDQPAVSSKPSCSTIHSDDTESEFAYESPAVLRSGRRLAAVCSPQDISRTPLDQSLHNLPLTQSSHPHISTAVDHSTMHSHQPNRRYVDMFSEASL